MKIIVKRLGDNTKKKWLLLQIGRGLLAYQQLRDAVEEVKPKKNAHWVRPTTPGNTGPLHP